MSAFSEAFLQVATSSTAAVVGGILAFVSVRTNERKKAAHKLELEVQSVCKAIRAELECLGQRYASSVGDALSQHDSTKLFGYTYPVFEDYFTVYNSNAQMLGKIQSDEIRTQIVQTYIAAKAQIDALRLNNKMLEKLEDLSSQVAIAPNPYHEEKLAAHSEAMTRYTPMLQAGNYELMTSIAGLVKKL